MKLSIQDRPLNGCRLESSPVSALEFDVAPGADTPSFVDLRAHCSDVEDQRLTNSCTANAIVGALEYHQRRLGQPVTELSRLFVYYNARRLDDSEARDVGSFIHHVMASVLAHGACEERLWPFQEAMCMTRPTEAAYANALKFQAVQYARTPLGEPAMAALASGLPVVFATYIPQAFYAEAASTGSMPSPSGAVPVPGGGHAMLLVGYDLTSRTWLARNSWGADWADDGYVRIPFDTLKAYSDPTHYWTIGAIDQSPKLQRAGSASVSQPFETRKSTIDLQGIRARAKSMGQDLSRSLESTEKDFRDELEGR